MANIQTALRVQHFRGADGIELAFRELGEGRPLVLIHGYVSTATVNWVRYGHAAKIAAQGHRVVMPDLRGHGDSAKPHDADAYPPDILAADGLALVEHLGLTDYDLGGYSLGARTTLRMLARGARPARAIVAGTGLEGIIHTQGRGEFFRRVFTNPGTFPRGSKEWATEAFLKTVHGDTDALLRVLDTFTDTPRDALARMDLPILVLIGADDQDSGSAEELTQALPRATYRVVPGNHMSAVTRPELGEEMAQWLVSPF